MEARRERKKRKEDANRTKKGQREKGRQEEGMNRRESEDLRRLGYCVRLGERCLGSERK